MGISLDRRSHYPFIRRSERRTVGMIPDQIGNETVHMETEPINDIEVPTSYEEAMSRKDSATWKRAMELEMKLLNKLNMWELVQLPPGRTVVKTRWVYDTKRNGDEMIVRSKARLVATEFSQLRESTFRKSVSLSHDILQCFSQCRCR